MSNRKLNAHIWEREQHEHYIEMRWNSRVLFQHEIFRGFIHDPCCGWGRIPEEARRAGYVGVTGSDIVDRGFPGTGIENFLGTTAEHDNIVFNPPFDKLEKHLRHAHRHARRKVASIFPCRRLNAAPYLRELQCVQIWYLTPRPSMPTGRVVEELLIGTAGTRRSGDPSGGTEDFCWVVLDKGASPGQRIEVGWLHRDRGVL